MKKVSLFFILFVFSLTLSAQNNSWMQYLTELAENEDADENYIESLYEELVYLSENPFNIQTVGKQDLERLPFLTDMQIENLLYYIYRYAPIVDIHELKNVEGLDRQTIDYLLPFVYLGQAQEAPLPDRYRRFRIKQETSLGTNFTVQEKAGYQKISTEEKEKHPNHYYLGSPYALSLRYNWNYKDKIQFGLTGKKEAGEAFWSKYQKGFDYYATSLTFKDLGCLKTLVFGNYQLSFGEGLVLNNYFSMGKTSDVININKKNTGIKRDVSTNEIRHFNGVAGTLKFDRLEMSFFFSQRNLDAIADSTTVYSFKTDGYHRTVNDLQKKNDSGIDLMGSHIQWQNDCLSAGITFLHYSFDGKELNPDPKPYNLYYLRGKEHYNGGIHYAYHQRKINFHGETALDKSGKMASIHNLSFTPASFVSWVVSYRYFMKDYNALYSNAFSESTMVQNENGLYAGMKIHLFRRWELATYWDYFRFPWLKYEIDSPSSGNDFLTQLSYTNQNIQMNIRYRWKEKCKNQSTENGHEIAVLPYDLHHWMYRLNYQPTTTINLKTQADGKWYKSATKENWSWSLTQTLSFSPDKERFQLDGGLAYFHAPDWDTRIALYEKNVLYTFSFTTCYGEGLRYYATFKWKISQPLTLYLKAASTHYFDRNTISSGLEKIEGKEKSDIYFLIKYRF